MSQGQDFLATTYFIINLSAASLYRGGYSRVSKRPNVLGQDLIKEDNRAKKCFDKSETESEIIV